MGVVWLGHSEKTDELIKVQGQPMRFHDEPLTSNSKLSTQRRLYTTIFGGPIGAAMVSGAMDHQQTARQEGQELNVGSGGAGGYSNAGGQIEASVGRGSIGFFRGGNARNGYPY